MPGKLRFALPAAALAVSGCFTDGDGGPFGIVAFDKTRHVAAAEPLFGLDEDKCFDSPAFLMSLMSAKDGNNEAGASGPGSPFLHLPVCRQLREWVRASMPFTGWNAGRPPSPDNAAGWSVATAGSPAGVPAPPYNKWQRNEVIDAMLSSSNRKCGRYVAFLQTYDANVNNGLGILSLASAGMATVLGGEQTAKALAGTSAFFNGSRGTLNETHFRNRSVAILAIAFENARADQRRAITNAQQCEPEQYSMMRGMEDAFRYHSTCSITAGFDEATRAVQRASAPDLESMKKFIADLQGVRTDMARFVKTDQDSAGTQTTGGTATETPEGQGPASKQNSASKQNGNGAEGGKEPGSIGDKKGGTDQDRNAPACPFKAAAKTS
jgi:hypothetical protein